MSRVNQIASVVFLLGSVLVGIYSWMDLQFYTRLGPGPGFFPFWLSVIFGILSVIMFCQATFGRPEPMPTDFYPTRTGYLRIGAIILTLVGTALMLEPLGFRLTMLLFYLFLLYVLGKQNLIVTTAVALTGSFGIFYVFVTFLKIPLPVGMLGI